MGGKGGGDAARVCTTQNGSGVVDLQGKSLTGGRCAHLKVGDQKDKVKLRTDFKPGHTGPPRHREAAVSGGGSVVRMALQARTPFEEVVPGCGGTRKGVQASE